jgi:hypothetical protein
MTDNTDRIIARKAATMWTRKAAAFLVEAQLADMNPDKCFPEDAADFREKAREAAQLAREWRAKAENDAS